MQHYGLTQSPKKINTLKEVEDFISKRLYSFIDMRLGELNKELNIWIIFSVILFAISFIACFIVIKSILKRVDE